MSTVLLHGPIAVLNLPKTNLSLIAFAKSVHGAMANNPTFSKPVPDMATFDADIGAFEDAETKAATKAKGAAAARNAKRKKVTDDLHHLRDYVQGVSEAQADPALAVAVIESTFMAVKKPPARAKPALEARNGDLPGVVLLIAKAVGKQATYYWEHSVDQITWTTAPETMKAHTIVAGLGSAQKHYFRFHALTPSGPIDYSQVVSLIVH